MILTDNVRLIMVAIAEQLTIGKNMILVLQSNIPYVKTKIDFVFYVPYSFLNVLFNKTFHQLQIVFFFLTSSYSISLIDMMVRNYFFGQENWNG